MRAWPQDASNGLTRDHPGLRGHFTRCGHHAPASPGQAPTGQVVAMFLGVLPVTRGFTPVKIGASVSAGHASLTTAARPGATRLSVTMLSSFMVKVDGPNADQMLTVARLISDRCPRT